MKQKILIAEGDMRQIYCAKRLSEKYDSSVAGFSEDCLGGLKSADLQGFH
ncbi:MAG: hypothetical protein LUG26_09005 [Ruminococcus sp.]|nr:hypothetical protein [Ruminococcus sp.]